MDMRRILCPAFMFVGALSCVTNAACVDPFGGSSIVAVFEPGVQAAATDIADAIGGRPPPNTYYAFYAVDITYQTDDEGNVVEDELGFPIVETSYAYEAQRFEIVPMIKRTSPCFIDLEEARYPGIHVTEEYNKFCEQTGIDCTSTDTILDTVADSQQREYDITDVLTAKRRHELLPAIESDLKAVAGVSIAVPPGEHPGYPVADECVEDNPDVDPTAIPPPHCIGSESNARRLAICRSYWKEEPTYWEGSDKVYTLPLNGKYYGVVDGTNPKNNGGVSGAQFFDDARLAHFDAFLMNWQYKDANEDGEPDYPDDYEDTDKSSIGYHYMQGTPEQLTRGTTSVFLSNRVFNITAEINIIDSLGEDDVHF